MSSSLVAFDTNKIKSYVFGTGTLKEIRGASALLDRLNQEDMVELAGGVGNTIYANGGGGLFKVDGGDAEAKLVIEQVKRVYRQKTKSGASITGVSVPLPAQTKNIEQELKLIRYRLRLAKDQSNAKIYPVTHPLFRFCDSCGTCYAQTPEQGDMLCESCCQKREEDRKVKNDIGEWAYAPAPKPANPNRLWGKLLQNLRQQNIHLLGRDRPEDFDQIGEQSRPKGYMGLIYADGDGMGKIIEGITSDEEMTRFADAVNDSIYEATGEAIGKYLEPESGSTWPFDVLLLGGDDLVIVTRAQSAIEVALHVVERFPELTKQKWGNRLNLSASVVITHVKYPIGSLVKLAESGLKFAKRQAAKQKLQGETIEGGLLNFLVVSSANQLDFGEHYKQTLRQEEQESILYRTQRPYTAQEMHDLLAQIRMLREKGVPRGKLEQLRMALFKSRKQGTLDAMMAALRLSNRTHVEALLELVGHQTQQKLNLPWIEKGKNWVTPVLDITELFDFVR